MKERNGEGNEFVLDQRTFHIEMIRAIAGPKSHWFPVVGEGHQHNTGVKYTHYKDSLLKVG